MDYRQREAARLLVHGMRASDIHARLKVHPTTLSRWKQDAKFQLFCEYLSVLRDDDTLSWLEDEVPRSVYAEECDETA